MLCDTPATVSYNEIMSKTQRSRKSGTFIKKRVADSEKNDQLEYDAACADSYLHNDNVILEPLLFSLRPEQQPLNQLAQLRIP